MGEAAIGSYQRPLVSFLQAAPFLPSRSAGGLGEGLPA